MGDVVKRFFYFELWWLFCSAERNNFCNFDRGSLKEYSCKIISKSGLEEDVS